MKDVHNFLCFYILFIYWPRPQGLQDLSSLMRAQTSAPAVKVPSPNHWTTREFHFYILKVLKKNKRIWNICTWCTLTACPTKKNVKKATPTTFYIKATSIQKLKF